jgi:hypothetical protein
MDSEKKLTRVNDTDAGKTTAGMGATQPKKPYNAPQLTEHGSVEEITGFIQISSSGLENCWIAAVVFGEDFYFGPRVNLVRRWLVNDYEKSGAVARLVMGLYRKYGERVAKVVEKSSILKRGFRKLFDKALAKAEAKYATHVTAGN